jgi:hypothetical protein
MTEGCREPGCRQPAGRDGLCALHRLQSRVPDDARDGGGGRECRAPHCTASAGLYGLCRHHLEAFRAGTPGSVAAWSRPDGERAGDDTLWMGGRQVAAAELRAGVQRTAVTSPRIAACQTALRSRRFRKYAYELHAPFLAQHVIVWVHEQRCETDGTEHQRRIRVTHVDLPPASWGLVRWGFADGRPVEGVRAGAREHGDWMLAVRRRAAQDPVMVVGPDGTLAQYNELLARDGLTVRGTRQAVEVAMGFLAFALARRVVPVLPETARHPVVVLARKHLKPRAPEALRDGAGYAVELAVAVDRRLERMRFAVAPPARCSVDWHRIAELDLDRAEWPANRALF